MTKKVVLKIESLAPLGDGVSTNNSQFYYVPGAIPGDLVEAEIKKTDKRGNFTQLLQIIEPSPHRRKPQCPVFGKCGGCALLQAEELLQRRAKQESLERQFDRHPVRLISAGPPLGYRRLARIHVKKKKNGTVQTGFFATSAHHIIDIDHCPILDPRISAVLPVLKQGMLQHIKEATVRIAAGIEGVFVYLQTQHPPDPAFYKAATTAVPNLLGGVTVEWNEIVSLVAGTDELSVESNSGRPILLPVGSFGQANSAINRELVSTVTRWAAESGAKSCIELFAGAGNFSFEMVNICKKITLVELDARACKTARRNVDGHAHVVCDDATKGYQRHGKNADLVLLDPPRTGAKELVMEMANAAHPDIIYVSCNPATLKRDLAYLQKGGYQLEDLVGFDMFPQTAHVEAAAWLKKR